MSSHGIVAAVVAVVGSILVVFSLVVSPAAEPVRIPVAAKVTTSPEPGVDGSFARPGELRDRLQRQMLDARQGEYADVAGWDGTMPRRGEARVLALRVEFPEGDGNDESPVMFGEGDSAEAMQSAIGMRADGTPAGRLGDFPYENLSSYYLRSSYGMLRISGDTYGYEARLPRSAYETDLMLLFSEALGALDPEIDFRDYDGDGDGVVDCVCMWFAGGDTGWGTTWWSHTFRATTMRDPGMGESRLDGISLGSLVAMHRPPSDAGCTRTLIHEVGHALGLPDYYAKGGDGETPANSRGGIGTEDMMNANSSDHNAFSKWMLGWLGDDDIVRVTRGSDGRAVAMLGDRVLATGEDGRVRIPVAPLSGDGTPSMPRAAAIYPAGDDGSLGPLSDLYVLQYDTLSGNQWRPAARGRGIVADDGLFRKFQMFRVQGTLSGGLASMEHDDVGDARHDQLIEAVIPEDGDQESVGQGMTTGIWSADVLGLQYTGLTMTEKLSLIDILGNKAYLSEGDEVSPADLMEDAPADSLAARDTGIHVRVAETTDEGGVLEVWYD